MVEFIPPPEPRDLLPPLLACLPTAFVSTRPPPALLPLLSPILRQRVQIFSSVSDTPSDSWIRLLCWGDVKADHVSRILDGMVFEPHPVSGEIEVPEDLSVTYKRVDEETLHSKITLPEYQISLLYLWCSNDPDGAGPGWRIAELQPRENADDTPTWADTIGDANDRSREQIIDEALKAAESHPGAAVQDLREEQEDDDDDYWAQYDNTPGRTPSIKTPAPRSMVPPPVVSEDLYFSRYADVQPAMDNHDPEEEVDEPGTSTINGDLFANILQQHSRARDIQDFTALAEPEHDPEHAEALSHPRPSSASSGSAVAKLELEAESQSASEVAIKQHIGTSIKSLYRLAKTSGMARQEFQRLIRNEIELLSLSDDE
ncbi:hypothetical protein BGW36DRAFT_357702 [Talaromyces proteolyticus]|uniref:Uncharacterized protein n=1 Tax=Talaromyces proteolyticus TaxID=1131652 RepID=A0AAD4KX29_9EURO|nr:uncharacterized protein BGW36DRAFT_357702 [Talaromyces proteolyticus]KAH8701073.1 hypothetical protein BGW36DRAFT_357702 [Talaromyces proteolyticus]